MDSTSGENSIKSAEKSCLSNSVILRKIFSHLPSRFLIHTCSVVNKQWKLEARSVLSKYRNYTATISAKATCAELKELDSIIAVTTSASFNGLTITMCQDHHDDCIENVDSISEFYRNIWSLHLKYFKFHGPCYLWSQNADCPAIRLAFELLLGKSSNLLELELTSFANVYNEFWGGNSFKSLNLVNLKMLSIGYCSFLEDRSNFVGALIQYCPNLCSIRGNVTASLLLNIPENMYEVIDDFSFNPQCDAELEKCFTLVERSPKLRTLSIRSSYFAGISPDIHCPQIGRIIAALLESNKESLEVLGIQVSSFGIGSESWCIHDVVTNHTSSIPQLQKLHTVALHDSDSSLYHPHHCLKKLFHSIPNLHKLKTCHCTVSFLKVLPVRYYHLIEQFDMRIQTVTDMENCEKLASCKPKLRDLSVSDDYFQCDTFPPIVTSLMESSQDVLEKLSLSLDCELNPLINFPTLPRFNQLKELLLYTDLKITIATFRRIDFPMQLTALKRVSLGKSSSQCSHDTENCARGRCLTREEIAGEYRSGRPSMSVKDLHICLDESSVKLDDISAIFPAVTELSITVMEIQAPEYLEQVWTGWPKLVKFRFATMCPCPKFDHAFLGVHQEEMAELNKFDRGVRHLVHIVPTRPSVVNLTHLKKLLISLCHRRSVEDEQPMEKDWTCDPVSVAFDFVHSRMSSEMEFSMIANC